MLKRMINRIIYWASKEDARYSTMGPGQAVPYTASGKSNRVSIANIDQPGGMNFTVYSATGGKVIQFSTYDGTRDRSLQSLYVVTDKEDLGEELAQIITRELLTR